MNEIVITRADQDVARLDVKLAQRLGEPVDPRVQKIADMDRATLPDTRRPTQEGPTASTNLANTGTRFVLFQYVDPSDPHPLPVGDPFEVGGGPLLGGVPAKLMLGDEVLQGWITRGSGTGAESQDD
ncbi:hypothetical protein [uncultured Serinicoccus sp.]|uniref:hypothetical protein n=1 Tax=uncultured Serinicoccus sp. TaxID=735514 RepID=UPI0026317D9C|nr:hypothetical protein [uncultured Serinicoccus sp.]